MTGLMTKIETYLHHCEYQKKLNEKTLKAYRTDLVQFSLYANKGEDQISKACITGYTQELHKKYMPKSAKRKIACLRAFLNYLEFEEEIEDNPINKMRLSFKEPVTLPKSLSFKTVQKLLKTVYEAQAKAKSQYCQNAIVRDIAILELLFATGLRVSELCSIKSENINLREGYVKVNGKGSRERIIFITNPDVLMALREYKKLFSNQIESTGYFFVNRLGKKISEQSVRSMLQKYTEKANISEHITPHTIRHTFATLMLEEDVDIRYIQSILGHSSITTTQIYTYVSQGKQKKIMIKKHPRNKFHI